MYKYNPIIQLYTTAHRILLEKTLVTIFKKFKFKKDSEIFDFGSGKPRYKYLSPYSKWNFYDINPKHKDVEYSDIKSLPIKDIDLFLCLEVIQYLNFEDIEDLICKLHKLIKVRGKAVISTPYLYPINHKENIRLTKMFFEYFVKNKFDTECIEFGNLFSIIHDLLFFKIYNLKNNFQKKFFLLLLLPIKYFSLIPFNNFFNASSGYIFILSPKN